MMTLLRNGFLALTLAVGVTAVPTICRAEAAASPTASSAPSHIRTPWPRTWQRIVLGAVGAFTSVGAVWMVVDSIGAALAAATLGTALAVIGTAALILAGAAIWALIAYSALVNDVNLGDWMSYTGNSAGRRAPTTSSSSNNFPPSANGAVGTTR